MRSKVFRRTIQYFRIILRHINRRCGKGAPLVYVVFAIAALYPLNWVYQVARKAGELLAPISASFFKSPDSTWRVYGPSSTSIQLTSCLPSSLPPWLRSRVMATRSRPPTGAGAGNGIRSKSIIRPQARSECFSSPTVRLPRLDDTAYTSMRWSRTGPGMTWMRAGEMSSTPVPLRAMPSN